MPETLTKEMLGTYREAFSKGSVESLRQLEALGVDLNASVVSPAHGFDGNAFHNFGGFAHTSFGDGDRQVAWHLKAQGVDVNALNSKGETPLMRAVQVGDLKDAAMGIIETLAEMGGDIHARDAQGRTLLHLASAAGNWNAYKLLHMMGVDSEACDAEGNYAFEFWRKLTPASIAHVSLQKDIGLRLTRIFNFKAGTYTCVTHNLATKAEAVTDKPLAAMDGTELMTAAREALQKRGGETDAFGKIRPAKGLR